MWSVVAGAVPEAEMRVHPADVEVVVTVEMVAGGRGVHRRIDGEPAQHEL